MKIGIVDADLLSRTKHRFPNLVCMKLSGYYKEQGHDVSLLSDWAFPPNAFDKIFISKVFTDTYCPDNLLKLSNVEYGGTGFFYDKAKPLPYEVEHHMPDYHLYDKYFGDLSRNDLKYYRDYSIGFTTRGCIRGCSFCVNQNRKSCEKHSSVYEFMADDRKYICLLDDNVLACKEWRSVFDELNSTGKRFQFKQGMDERLLTPEKCKIIFNSHWIGDYIFAFDNIKDKELIQSKLDMLREYTNKVPKFYCFCGYNHQSPDNYSIEFWKQDIADLFERIAILMKYNCLPYIMRYKDYELSPYRGMYIDIAAWCNQPNFFKKKTFRELVSLRGEAAQKYAEDFEKECPEIAYKYYDMRWQKNY